MHVTTTTPSDTETVLTITVEGDELAPVKRLVLKKLQPKVKLAGFRPGKAPLPMVEKNIDQSTLQTEFLEEAISNFYASAVRQESLRPIDRPNIEIKKFVPFTTIKFTAKVTTISNMKLPDYKKIKKSRSKVEVSAKDVEDVLKSLQTRMAEKKDVDRPAKQGDQIWIDFQGVDSNGEPVKGAAGKDYPVQLGSDTFIPGFEKNLIGLMAGNEKTFSLTFPANYGVKALAGKKVEFTVNVTKVQELDQPKIDDDFIKKVGPFDSLKALKADIKKQLMHERQHEADRRLESELVMEIANRTEVSIPQILIDSQIEALIRDIRKNLTYRGLTYQEYLEREGRSEEDYRKNVLAPEAERRVRASLALAEIAEKENIHVTPEELDIRIQLLRNQYQDDKMRAELDDPENRQDIASRLLTEKTVAKLISYAIK